MAAFRLALADSTGQLAAAALDGLTPDRLESVPLPSLVKDLRALLESTPPSSAVPTLTEFLDRYSQTISTFPWIERLCLPLLGITPMLLDDKWWAIDAEGLALPMRLREDAGYKLMAVAGGQPVDIAAEYDGQTVRPLTVAL